MAQQFITTFDASGRSVFTSKVPEQQNPLALPVGTITFLYTTHAQPVDLSTEADLDHYAEDRVKGLPPGAPCPPNGTSACVIRIAPNGGTPMRRTLSMGVFAVIEGELALQLDSGEERRLKAGDVAVMRAALHKWSNVTPNDGWVKLLVFAQHVDPVEVEGKKLEAEWA